jgi:predicted acetyltransferase
MHTTNPAFSLVWPAHEHLASYVAALQRGWSPNNLRQAQGQEELLLIQGDPDAFLAGLDSRQGNQPPVKMPDGSTVPRLPGYRRWMWDGGFCGSIGLRWQAGSNEMPPYCLGHIGYAVVPWKQRNGYATQALALLLKEAPAAGLTQVDITTDPGNLVSQRVITKNGGVLVEKFTTVAAFGSRPEYRFRIVF